MLVFLNQAYRHTLQRVEQQGRRLTAQDIRQAIIEGACLRVRPKVMTAATVIIGLLPVMWGTGTGSEVMRRIAAPMVGGMLSALVLTLIVIPAIYWLWKSAQLRGGNGGP